MSSFEKDSITGSTPEGAAPRRRTGGPVLTRRAGLAGLAGIGAFWALTACGGNDDNGSGSGGSADPSAIIKVYGGEPTNPLVPTSTNENQGGKIITAIFAGLVYFEADGTAKNDLAESIDTSDAQNYTIKIKSGQTFSDGSPVTAKSFVDAWNYGALSTNAQLQAYFFEPIEGYDAVSADPPTAQTMSGLVVVDDTTFTVKLVQPQSDFQLAIGSSSFYPLPESAYADMKAFGENPIGNGPYKFKAAGAWVHNQGIELVKNDTYKGARTAKNGGLSITFYTTTDAAYSDLQSGSLDILDIGAIPTSALASFTSDLGDRALKQPSALFQSFTIPWAEAHFSGAEGKLRRQALSHAIDRASVVKAVFSGTRTPAKDYTSPVIDGYSDDIDGNDVLEFDAAKAKQLWAQAEAMSPYTDTLTLSYNADGPHQTWVDAVTAQWRQNLGIKAEGKPYPTFAQFRTAITDRQVTGAFRTGWQADYPSLYNFLAPIYATGAGSNDGDYSNPDFDKAIAAAASDTDKDESNSKLNSAQTILFQDLPAIPLWYDDGTGGYSEAVSGVKMGWDSVVLNENVTKSA